MWYGGVSYLDSKYLMPTHVSDNPLIHPGRAVQSGRSPLAGTSPHNNPPAATEELEQTVDLLIRDLWSKGVECTLNMTFIHIYAASYAQKTPDKSLQTAGLGLGGGKYLYLCLQQYCQFYPAVVSVDGLMGIKAESNLKRLGSWIAAKWQKAYSRTCKYVQSRAVITMVCDSHFCNRISWVPEISIRFQWPQWEDVSKFNLYQ